MSESIKTILTFYNDVSLNAVLPSIMKVKQRIPFVVIGAGISGLVLSQCLRRQKIPVRIYERMQNNATRNNYGITLSHHVYERLIRALVIGKNAFIDQVAVRNPHTGAVVSDEHSLRVNRAALHQLLQEGLDIRWSHELKHLASEKIRRAHVQIAKPLRSVSQDVRYGTLIAADGVHSATRTALAIPAPEYEPKPLPFVVFNGKRHMAPESLSGGLEECFATPDGIIHRVGDVVLTIKADFWNKAKQQLGIGYTLSRPTRNEKDEMLLQRGTEDAEALSRLFVDEITNLKQLPSPFDSVFDPDLMKEDRLLHWLMRSSLLEKAKAVELAGDKGVILLGDAAHAQPIVGGNGANEAIEDGRRLAGYIQDAKSVRFEQFLSNRETSWAEARLSAVKTLLEMHSTTYAKASL